MTENTDFKMFDIPVVCSVFMPVAFDYYADSLAPIPDGIKDYYVEWVKVLPEVLRQPCFKEFLGKTGRDALTFLSTPMWADRCVASSTMDIGFQSMYNVIRNTETLNYLLDKKKRTADLRFVDLGVGFCPLSAALQNEYNLSDVYVVDKQPVLDAYGTVAYKVGGKSPQCVTWGETKAQIKTQRINTVVAMGLFPYLPLDEQMERLCFISEYCQNFFIEVKHNCKRNFEKPEFFDTDTFGQLRSTIDCSQEVEKKTRQKTWDYYRRFYKLNKNRFRQKEFSIFVSR